jgi:hypothetical protein
MTNCIILFFHIWTFYKKSSNDQKMISDDFFLLTCDFTWNTSGKIGSDDKCIMFIKNLLYVANK